MSNELPGAGVRALIPPPAHSARTKDRSEADAAVRDFVAQIVDKHALSSCEVMAMLTAVTSSYAMAIRRRHDSEGSR